MLFDLRGRGRRRAVQVIYLSLALLMGGGLVLFGIGGATSGGLLDAFKNGGGKSTNDIFQKRVKAAEHQVRIRPKDPAAWANLTKVRYQQAGSGEGFDQTKGVFTDSGKQELHGAEQAWDKYLSLTSKPDDTVASMMVQAFSPSGLDEPDKAVNAMEIILDRRPGTGPLYVQLAALAYQAGQTRKAELASQKALELTPKDSKEQIKAQLQAARLAASAAVGATTGGKGAKGGKSAGTATVATLPKS